MSRNLISIVRGVFAVMFLATAVHAADAGKPITINAVEYRVWDLGIRGSATWTIAAAVDGYRLSVAQGESKPGSGTKNLKLITVTTDGVSPAQPIDEPNVPGAKPGAANGWEGASGKTIRLVLPSGKVAGIANQIEAGGLQSRAFAPTPDGGSYTFLPKPDPRQCSGAFDAVGGSDITLLGSDGSLYGFFVVGKGGNPIGTGLLPVRWSITKGVWKCQALTRDLAILSETQIDFAAATEQGIFLNVSNQKNPESAGLFRSSERGTDQETGVVLFTMQPFSIRHQSDGVDRAGRILDVQGDNIVGCCWKITEPKSIHPFIWPGSVSNVRVVDAITGDAVRGGAIIGDTMFVTTVQAGVATTTAFTGELTADVKASGLAVDAIVGRAAGGFIADGSFGGTKGWWLVTTANAKP